MNEKNFHKLKRHYNEIVFAFLSLPQDKKAKVIEAVEDKCDTDINSIFSNFLTVIEAIVTFE